MNNFKFGKQSKIKLYGGDSRPGVASQVADLCEKALGYSTVDFAVIDGFRLVDDQTKLFAEGHSELDGITELSDHQYGMAIDVLPVVRDSRGNRLDAFDIKIPEVRVAWLEVYHGFMRAAFKAGLDLEFGFAYNIHGGRDWPHVSILGYVPKDFSGLAMDPQ